jgi:hypothetical protein
MKFIFFCPEKHRAFETGDYRIIKDKGVKTDESGNKVWDAKVEVAAPCPVCGRRHIVDVTKVLCPFS